MTVTTHRIEAAPERVFAVLADGWSYAGWVVGTSTIRAVERTWPAPGARLFHAVGAWPLMVKDHTRVLECEPGRRLLLRARGWPLGEADIDIVVEPAGTGSVVTMIEDPVSGPGMLLRNPAGEAFLDARNKQSLERLGALSERHEQPQI
jgi:uncharacterized protein YndB with AHSA1/START domain